MNLLSLAKKLASVCLQLWHSLFTCITQISVFVLAIVATPINHARYTYAYADVLSAHRAQLAPVSVKGRQQHNADARHT